MVSRGGNNDLLLKSRKGAETEKSSIRDTSHYHKPRKFTDLHYSDVIMSTMASQFTELNSPTSRVFTQPFIQAQINENIKALRHWPLWGWPVTGEFPAQRASNAENVSIWWRHHVYWLLTHRTLNKMTILLQTTFLNASCWMNSFIFRLKFHWNLFLLIQLTIRYHWFR